MKSPTDVPVIITPEPFSPKLTRLFSREGATVAQIMLEAVRGDHLALADLPRTNVYLDGDIVDRREALDLVPRAGQILNLSVQPAGSGGGGRDQNDKVMDTIIAIAVITVSAFVGSNAGIQFGIGMLIRATLAPMVSTDRLEEGKNQSALAGAQNGYRPREPFPLILGSGRVMFDIGAMPYTSNEGDVVWLCLVFVLHYGPCTVSDIKIGETLLEDYPAEDVVVEYRLAPAPYASTLYPNDVVQEGFADELPVARTGEPVEWEVHTANAGAERIEVDLSFPQGLKFTKDSGGILRNEVQIVVEVAEVGTEAWAAPDLIGAPYYNRHNVAIPAGNYYVAAMTNDALYRTIAWESDPGTHWKVRARAFDPDDDERDKVVNKTFWSGLRSIVFSPPILDDTPSLVIMKIKSTDDLNGTLPPVSGVVTPIVPTWNGSEWGPETASGNFAACMRWLLTGPAAAAPMTAEQIDDTFGDAYDLIEANGWGGLVEVRGEASQDDVIRQLSAAGRFLTYWNGQALVAVPDWTRPTPRQIFTPRNASGYRYRRGFPDPVHAVMVEFRNLEGLDDEVFVYAEGYGPESAEIIESIRPPFICTIERAYRHGELYLLRRDLQQEVHEWSAGWDTLATTLGDRVLVRHPSLLIGITDGRVSARRFAGALVRGFRLDGFVDMEEGVDYAVDIRRVDGTIRGVPVLTVPGRQRELLFVSPRDVADSPEAGDLIVFGRVDLITEDLEILDVDASSDMAATLRAVRYIGEEIAALEAEALPTGLISTLQAKAPPPVPRIIDANGSPEGVLVAFAVDPVRSGMLTGFAVRWRRTPDPLAVDGTGEDWVPLPPLPAGARQVKTPSLEAFGYDPTDTTSIFEVDVSIQTVFRSGAVSLAAIVSNVAAFRDVLEPLDFTATGANHPAGGGGGSYPVIELNATPTPLGPRQTLEVEFRPSEITGTESGTGTDWTYLAGLPANAPTAVKRVNGPETYDVRARWATFDGWYSAWVYRNEIAVTADQYDTPQVVIGALTRITYHKSHASTVTIPSWGGSPGYILIKTMDFEVDEPDSAFTLDLSFLYESQVAPTWGTVSGHVEMTNADEHFEVNSMNGPVTSPFTFEGLNVGINTVEIYGNSEGSGSHVNTANDPYFQVTEDKKPQ
jgi:hypothetical protein